MYLRYDENSLLETKNNISEVKVKTIKQKKREKSKFELILSIGAVLFVLEYTKQHGYFTTTEEQFILAFVLAIILNFVIESFMKWISR